MNLRPHHITFTVKNIDESIRWYNHKLGLPLIIKYQWQGLNVAHLKLGDIRLELFECGKETEPLPDYRKDLLKDLHVMGVKHLCIETDDIEKLVTDLKKKNVEFIQEINAAGIGGRKTFFKDCNGILVELYQK